MERSEDGPWFVRVESKKKFANCKSLLEDHFANKRLLYVAFVKPIMIKSIQL